MRIWLLLALALVACGPLGARDAPPAGTPQAECLAEARRSPEVRTVMREVNPTNPENLDRIRRERMDIEARLVADCLRARGLPAPGGVEPVRRF